jgi:CheY-like chemotaxis protein
VSKRAGSCDSTYVRRHFPPLTLPSCAATDSKFSNLRYLQPVCAVTGNAREAQRKECLEAGFDDVRPLKDVLFRPGKANFLAFVYRLQIANKPYDRSLAAADLSLDRTAVVESAVKVLDD